MKRFTSLCAFYLFTFVIPTLACDCDYQGDFLKVVPNAKLVALVKVTRFLTYKDIYNIRTPISMDVEIIDIYKGKESIKTVIVWGDNGTLCRPYLSQFTIGKHYVIAFSEGMDGTLTNANKQERQTDYSISNCGDFTLSVDMEKQTAFGTITNNQTEISLVDLKTRIK